MNKPRLWRSLALAVDLFHLVWIGLLFASVVCPQYRVIASIIVWSSVVSQLLWGWCPLVVLSTMLRNKADPNRGRLTFSWTCWLIRKIFKVEVPPIAVTVSLLVIATACTAYFLLTAG